MEQWLQERGVYRRPGDTLNAFADRIDSIEALTDSQHATCEGWYRRFSDERYDPELRGDYAWFDRELRELIRK